MRRRLPAPALVIASLALFAALAGAGVAATLFAPAGSPKPIMVVPASVSADGTVTGRNVKGARESVGVYTLTISGDTFASNATARGVYTINTSALSKGVTTIPPQCATASEHLASNGSATAQVDCFSFDPAAGWQPADAAFDIQMIGPSS